MLATLSSGVAQSGKPISPRVSRASATFLSVTERSPGHTVQSNPVSGSFLQKTTTTPKIRRDFRHSHQIKYQIRDAETLRLTQEARQRRDSSRNYNKNLSRPDWLAGWRRSADGPLLCSFSLLTGNLQGILQNRCFGSARDYKFQERQRL